MEVLIEKTDEICDVLKCDAVMDIIVIIFLFLIFIGLGWIRHMVDKLCDQMDKTDSKSLDDIKLIHIKHNKNNIPPVSRSPIPRGTEKECNHEWYEIDREYSSDSGWHITLYCPICKKEKHVELIEWERIKADQDYNRRH